MKIKLFILGTYLAISSAYGQLNRVGHESAILSADSPAGKSDSPHLKFTSSDFAGRWYGDENCSKISTPHAVLVIKSNGPEEVIIMGFYASNGGIKGTLSGNTITIPKQIVPDYDFRISVEGILVLSSDHQLLNSNVTIINDGLKDICANSYTR